jgi:uncharacterized protein YkuJ
MNKVDGIVNDAVNLKKKNPFEKKFRKWIEFKRSEENNKLEGSILKYKRLERGRKSDDFQL